jgi:hypothetical protein
MLTGPATAATAVITATAPVPPAIGAARGLNIGLGNQVALFANTEGVAGASFTVVAAHRLGDSFYGADSDSTATWQNAPTAGVGGKVPGAPVVPGDNVLSLTPTIEFLAPTWVIK